MFRHACEMFPAFVPEGAEGFDDLPFVDHELAGKWYAEAVHASRSFSSTGTSGPPKSVPWTAAEDAWYVGEKQDLFGPWLGDCARAFISLAVGHNASSAGRVLGDLGLAVHNAGLSTLTAQCDAIVSFAPHVLYCSPSILARLIGALRERGYQSPPVRRVITNGEVLLPSARAQIQDFFGIGAADVMDTYGSTEIGTIAYSCATCGGYHFIGGLYPEAVPAGVAARTVSAGTVDTVLAVSSVKRTSFPVVRFVTYDIVQRLRREVCEGVSQFTFDRILGRCDDLINYGELLSPYELANTIRRRLPGARWVVFNAANDLMIAVEGTEPAGFRDELRQRYPLHSRMSDLGLIDPLNVRFVRDFDRLIDRAGLPKARSGKDARRILRRAVDPAWFDEDGS